MKIYSELYNHIQSNVDTFLYDANRVKQLTNLHQIIKFATRMNSVLDWCLINMKDLGFEPIKLPPLGSSDHNSILIKGHLSNLQKASKDRVWKKDLRESGLRSFGQWITAYDWSEVLQIADCNQKYLKFDEIMSGMIQHFFPCEPTALRNCDKPWLTPFLKRLIKKRQIALHVNGKSSSYKNLRNKVQFELKIACKKYYDKSVTY